MTGSGLHAQLRQQHWQAQAHAGLGFVTVGDFALYDHVANHIQLLGCEPARFGSARKEAYEALQKSLATLTPLAAAPPPEVTAAVATWVDGFLALLPLSVREAMAAEARKSQGAPPESGCRKPQAPRSPAAQRALGRLRAMRQRCLVMN